MSVASNPDVERLVQQVQALCNSDDAFKQSFIADPIAACRSRFGADALPNEGETVTRDCKGRLLLTLPVTGAYWVFGDEVLTEEEWLAENEGQLPDELLEMVSAGSPSVAGPDTQSFS